MMQKFPKQIAYVIKKFTIVCRNCMLKLHAFSASFLCFKLCCHLCTIKLLIQFPLPVCGHTLICSEIHILNYQHLSAGNSGCCSYQWSKKDYVSEVWPPTGSFFIPPEDIWGWRATMEWYWHGKKDLGKKLSQCHFAHHKSDMDWPGQKPGSPRWEAGD